MTAQTMEPTAEEKPAAAFAGLSLDLKPLMAAIRPSAAAPAAAAPAPAPDAAAEEAAPAEAAPEPPRARYSLRVRELLDLTDSLTEALEAETDALRSMQMDRFAELSARKVSLANGYATQLWQMRKSPDALSGLPAEEREALREATERMRAASRDNESAVRGAHEASRILMNAIARAAETCRPSATTYGANGRAASGAGYGRAVPAGASAIFQDTRL